MRAALRRSGLLASGQRPRRGPFMTMLSLHMHVWEMGILMVLTSLNYSQLITVG